ncbi:hypothetical protein PVK06_002587 [Gossypium arboreum]|uniref:Uncharacterized protein n=1 Tax=Gossypium arboreum TaxID=29729 RepID=A0ABR0R568_GOSAR|nr:hypothetical protein PVK06_002587 [Gossypium arboreum]
METKSEECGVELAIKQERCITPKVELKEVTERHYAELERIINKCQEQVDRIFPNPFDVHFCLGFLCIYLEIRAFVEEGEGFGTAYLVPSIVGDAVTLVFHSVTEDVTIASLTIEDVAPTDQDQGGGDNVFD